MSMHTVPLAAAKPSSSRWPALAAAWYIGVFCVVAGGGVVWALLRGATLAESGVVLLAVAPRLVTVGIALSAVQAWGRSVPAWMVLAGLWGAAATQLVYPLAESVVKALIL